MAVPEPKGVNRYVLGHRIGLDEYSDNDIFEAIDLVTKKSVVVKRSKPADFDERNWISSQNEGEILSKLDHPNIIKLLDSYVHNDKHHLVLELMENDLKETVKEPCTLSPADCKAYMKMLLQGLAYLHQKFIAHGNLTCKNILIGPDGTLKLADFELARLLENESAHNFETDILDFKEIVKERTVESLSEEFPKASEGFLELYEQMFLYKPKRRITLQQALQHRYFKSVPLPTPAHLIPRKTRSAHDEI